MLNIGYLIAPRIQPRSGMHGSLILYSRSTQILFGTWFTDQTIEEQFQQISRIFQSHNKSRLLEFEFLTWENADNLDTSARTIKQGLPFVWSQHESYDIVKPFPTCRGLNIGSVWTVDLVRGVLFHTNREGSREIPLTRFQGLPVSWIEMETVEDVPLNSPVYSDVEYWKPDVPTDERMFTFVGKLLKDFNQQWSHILTPSYNCVTRRILARAIVGLCRLDFYVREKVLDQPKMCEGAFVRGLAQPEWGALGSDTIRIGNTWLILADCLEEGLQMARRKNAECGSIIRRRLNQWHDDPEYLILSINQVMVCRFDDNSKQHYTKPEPFLQGERGEASDAAIKYILWALSKQKASSFSLFHSIPLELQDMILSKVGTVQAGYLGCVLDLGSPFLWKHWGHSSLDLFDEEWGMLHEGDTLSRICFRPRIGTGNTGLAFVNDRPRLPSGAT
jgi:hypothetical protein